MTTILLTGFEPFGDEARNPSAEIVGRLGGSRIGGADVVGAVLPVVYGASADALLAAIEAHRPQAVISLGVAIGRRDVTPERVAVNLDDTTVADNAGAIHVETPIVDGGPVGYLSTLPVRAIADAIEAEEIAARVSGSAGAFVCNHVFYRLMAATAGTGIPAGFIHVPGLPGQGDPAVDGPGMELETMVQAVSIALEAVAADLGQGRPGVSARRARTRRPGARRPRSGSAAGSRRA